MCLGFLLSGKMEGCGMCQMPAEIASERTTHITIAMRSGVRYTV